VTSGVYDVDDRVGFRRHAVVTLADDAAIKAKRDEEEQAMLRDWLRAHDPAGGRTPAPSKSELTVGEHYEGVVLDVSRTWALVGVGAHTGVVPLAWSDRLAVTNPPDKGGGYRTRVVRDYQEKVDVDANPETPDVPMLRSGDVILVEVRAASTQDAKVAKVFAGTPGAEAGQAALALWQVNAVEGALFSYDLSNGAVRALVGGVDFGQSQFNRAIQAYRQVGSTFKPLVYTAAIESKRVTTASLVADAPLAFATNDDFVWKPDNFGGDYEGDMTLRKALMKSKNTCTIRIMESVDPTFTQDVVYNFTRKLGILGPPMPGSLPEELRKQRGARDLCPWIKEQPDFRVCMDRYPPLPEGLSDREHRATMKPDEVWWCRACDLSLALGSASLTMEELVRAYSVFPTGGTLVQPYYVEKVADRAGNVLEEHHAVEFERVIDPGVAAIGTWLLQSVVWGGTGAKAGQLGVQLGGKTGTTNDSKDTWFVGFSPNVATGVWVGFDDPGTLGGMATGSTTALPIWIDYMAVAATKKDDRPFPMDGIEWVNVDERTGKRVTNGGVRYPFLPGTVPESTGFAAGQVDTSDPTEL
jgi:penicillin-binding protein 1A